MLGSRPAAVFLVMMHHIKEITLMPLQEIAPSVLLTCLSFWPRRSRLPRATCNNILASVLTRLSPAPQLGWPCTLSHCVPCTYLRNLSVLGVPAVPEDPQLPGAQGLPSGPCHLSGLGDLSNNTAHIYKFKKTQICCLCSLWSTSVCPHQ